MHALIDVRARAPLMPRLWGGSAAPANAQTATAAATAGSGRAEAATSPAAEAALLLRVGRGDRGEPLRELYHLYSRRVYGLGLRLLGDPGLAEELVQETFLRLWRSADRYDPDRGAVSTFIYAIAKRLVIDLWRRPSSRPFQPEVEQDPEPDRAIDAVLTALTMRDVLDSLSPAHREVLELSYQADLTQAEIAGRLGVSLGTVKSRTFHALRACRRAMEERGVHA